MDEPLGGAIDEHNFLLGAVRLRLQLSTAAPGGCPEDLVLVEAHDASCRPITDTRDTLNTSDFVGPTSGMKYTYCEVLTDQQMLLIFLYHTYSIT